MFLLISSSFYKISLFFQVHTAPARVPCRRQSAIRARPVRSNLYLYIRHPTILLLISLTYPHYFSRYLQSHSWFDVLFGMFDLLVWDLPTQYRWCLIISLLVMFQWHLCIERIIYMYLMSEWDIFACFWAVNVHAMSRWLFFQYPWIIHLHCL